MIAWVRHAWARLTDPGPMVDLAVELSAEVEAARQGDAVTAEVQCARLKVANAGLRERLAAVTAERDELRAKLADQDEAPTEPIRVDLATLIAQMDSLEQENEKLRAGLAGTNPDVTRDDYLRLVETNRRLAKDVDRLTYASVERDHIRGWGR